MDKTVVAVGSLNPVKLAAVKAAFFKAFPQTEWEIVGYPVKSGVPDQPTTAEECLIGAMNRANNALEASDGMATYAVGLEGGLHKVLQHIFDCGWVHVRDQFGNFGIGSGGSMLLPPQIKEVVDCGYEVAVGVDRLFGQENSKHGKGLSGFITNGLYPLQDEYTVATIIALAPFINPNAYERGGSAWDRSQDGPLDNPQLFYCTHPGCHEPSALFLQDGTPCLAHVPAEHKWMFEPRA